MRTQKKTLTIWFAITVLACFLAVPAPECSGQGKHAFIQTRIQQTEPMYTGQRITFYITLHSQTQFTGVPRFELPQVMGVILMEIEDRPVMGQTEEQGVQFLTKTHEFAAFPQMGGRFLIPAFNVSFSYVDTSRNQMVEKTYRTTQMQLTATQPPGTKNISPLITTREFKVQAVWEPQPDAPKVGDAFKLVITRTTADIPGMVLPPVAREKINGLGTYEDPPVVEDRMYRGDFTGKRIETITYVCEKQGKFTIPELRFHWFDIEKKKLKTERIAPVLLNVALNHDDKQTDQVAKDTENIFYRLGWPAAMILLFISLAGFGIFRSRQSLSTRYKAWTQQRAASEKSFFKKFENACRANDTEKTLQALFEWMCRLTPVGTSVSIRKSFAAYADPELLSTFCDLEHQVYASPDSQKRFDKNLAGNFLPLVRKYRKYILDNRTRSSIRSNRLKPLNP